MNTIAFWPLVVMFIGYLIFDRQSDTESSVLKTIYQLGGFSLLFCGLLTAHPHIEASTNPFENLLGLFTGGMLSYLVVGVVGMTTFDGHEKAEGWFGKSFKIGGGLICMLYASGVVVIG